VNQPWGEQARRQTSQRAKNPGGESARHRGRINQKAKEPGAKNPGANQPRAKQQRGDKAIIWPRDINPSMDHRIIGYFVAHYFVLIVDI